MKTRRRLDGGRMTASSHWESFKADSASFRDRVKALVHEGNVRRVIVEHEGRTIAEFPLTAGVVGALLAPPLAALGAVVALYKDCTIHVERTDGGEWRQRKDA
jgi:hypothetical protein